MDPVRLRRTRTAGPKPDNNAAPPTRTHIGDHIPVDGTRNKDRGPTARVHVSATSAQREKRCHDIRLRHDITPHPTTTRKDDVTPTTCPTTRPHDERPTPNPQLTSRLHRRTRLRKTASPCLTHSSTSHQRIDMSFDYIFGSKQEKRNESEYVLKRRREEASDATSITQ